MKKYTSEQQQAMKILDELNSIVNRAIKDRTDFLDTNMYLFAEHEIGQEVVHAKRGDKATVVKHFRENHGTLWDIKFDVVCKLSNGDKTYNKRWGRRCPWVTPKDIEKRSPKYCQARRMIS
jgi:hypothetical protein